MDKQGKGPPGKGMLSGLAGKRNWLFAVGLAGILLIGLSDLWSARSAPEPAGQPFSAADTAEVEQALEQRLEALLAQVDGAGAVQVMVTLEDTGEAVYAQDRQSQSQEKLEDGVSSHSAERTGEHILFDGGSGSQALVETYLAPQVKGVAVLCSGGDAITVVKRITDLVSTVLDVPTNRVCVAKMS